MAITSPVKSPTVKNGGSSASFSVTMSMDSFVDAGIQNLSSSCRLKWWPTNRPEVRNESVLSLWPAAGIIVDVVKAFQRLVGLPVTGVVDDPTWAAFNRHAVARTAIGDALVLSYFSREAESESLAVKFCGENRSRASRWAASQPDVNKARQEQVLAAQKFPDEARRPAPDSTRNTVYVLAERRRSNNDSTEVYGLKYWEILRAAVWNSRVAALAPDTSTSYGSPRNAQVSLRVKRAVPQGFQALKTPASPMLALWVAQWELQRTAQPKGMFTAGVTRAIKEEIKADTAFGRLIGGLILFGDVAQSRAEVDRKAAEQRRAAASGARSAGVVSNLVPQLTKAQAKATEEQRKNTQVVRLQYRAAGSAVAANKGLVAQWQQNVGNQISEQARQGVARTAGRTGFVSPKVADSFRDVKLDYGSGLEKTVDTATGKVVSPQGEATTPDQEQQQQPPPPSDPTPFSAGEGAWSSATQEQLDAARRDEGEEAAWPEEVVATEASEGAPVFEGELVAEGTSEPSATTPQKGSPVKTVLVLAGVAALAYFLFREKR